MSAPLGAKGVVIDPSEGKPQLVGSRWRRRRKENDSWDDVRIVGVFDLGPDAGGLELVVQPVEFGQPAQTADVASFAAAYKRAEGDDPLERLDQRLRALEARA